MENSILVHRAIDKDFGEIQILFRKMFDIFSENQNVEYPYTENGINYLKDTIEKGFAFVAKEDDKVIGFLTSSIQEAIDFKTYENYGFIENMYVLDEYRKKGVGRALISEFINMCKNLNIEFIHTDSDANQSQINFYAGAGFKITGVNYTLRI